MLRLVLKNPLQVPLDAESLSPSALCNRTVKEIGEIPLRYGRRPAKLRDFFEIEGEPSDHLVMEGDLSKIRHLASHMDGGLLEVYGHGGMHLGAHMRAGTIQVHGCVGDWLGAEMRGGAIHVTQDAGNQVGGAYRGNRIGMNNGLIYVGRDAGTEVGLKMRRGTIVVAGRCGDFAGLHMKGGTIVIQQASSSRLGVWMRRGTIMCLAPITAPPSFSVSGPYLSAFLHVFAGFLRSEGVPLASCALEQVFVRHVGDPSIDGRGEILIASNAPSEP